MAAAASLAQTGRVKEMRSFKAVILFAIKCERGEKNQKKENLPPPPLEHLGHHASVRLSVNASLK